MSSTGRGADRAPDDFYETPAWATRAILRELGAAPSRILEPTAGRGAIVRAVREHWPSSYIVANELDAERAHLLRDAGADHATSGDFLAWGETRERFDLAITNPPFALAMPVIDKCQSLARETAVLLRLNFLGSQERAEFWRAVAADVGVLPKRPNFAASIKCVGQPKAKPRLEPCGWRTTIPIEEERPKACPTCGLFVSVTTSDSCEYAWFHFHPGASRRYRVLEVLAEAAQ